MKKIGVFGSSFNPPTLGHQDVIEQAVPQFDQILLVPSIAHAFGKIMASLQDRLEMIRLFIESSPHAKQLKIFNIEETIADQYSNKNRPIYTYDVLMALTDFFALRHEAVQLHFMLGPDNAATKTWHQFYRYQDIEKKWPLFIAQERLHIRATDIRKIVKSQTNPDALIQKLIPLTGEPIARYITRHALYRDTATS